MRKFRQEPDEKPFTDIEIAMALEVVNKMDGWQITIERVVHVLRPSPAIESDLRNRLEEKLTHGLIYGANSGHKPNL